MKKEVTEECISIINDILKTLEEDRGWLTIGSREDGGFLRAMKAVEETRAALERSKEKDTIKIRYAYIGSPTVWRFDKAYHETIRFKVLTIEQIETRSVKTTLEELTRDDKEELIKILGRDVCTGRVDMFGTDIYEGDIIRWFLDSGNYIDETIHQTSHFAELDTTRDCKVIGTIYDKGGIQS